MKGTAHFALSAALTFPAVYAVTRSPETSAALALAVGAASLLPDLDTGASLAAGILRVRWLSRLAQSTVGHRGPASHSLAACLLWAAWWALCTAVAFAPAGQAPSLSAASTVFWVVLAGSTLHVLEDWVPVGSKSGVPLLYPFKRERLKLGRRAARPRSRRAAPSPWRSSWASPGRPRWARR